MTASWTTITAQPSLVAMQVRIDPRLPVVNPNWEDDVADAIDFFVYEMCDACGLDVGDHIVTPGPFGKPFLFCEKGDDA